MSESLFKRVIDEIEGHVPYLTIASRGEPTLHKQFSDLLEYAKGKFLDLKINTNASLLNEQKIEAILDSCDTVVFSIDTPDSIEYPKIRVNGVYERVIKNMELFHQLKQAHPRSELVRTRASGVLYSSELSFQEYEKAFKDLVDECSFVRYQPWEELYQQAPNSGSVKTCNQPFYSLYVWWDGSYNSCDMDYKSHLTTGCQPISSKYSLKNAWSSHQLSLIRQKHLEGKRAELYPCHMCPMPL